MTNYHFALLNNNEVCYYTIFNSSCTYRDKNNFKSISNRTTTTDHTQYDTTSLHVCQRPYVIVLREDTSKQSCYHDCHNN